VPKVDSRMREALLLAGVCQTWSRNRCDTADCWAVVRLWALRCQTHSTDAQWLSVSVCCSPTDSTL